MSNTSDDTPQHDTSADNSSWPAMTDTDAAQPTSIAQDTTQAQTTQAVTVTSASDSDNNENASVCHSDTQDGNVTHECVNVTQPMKSVESGIAVHEDTAEMGLSTQSKPRKRRVYDPERHCGAKSRSAGMLPCTNAKGWKTTHPGEGRCLMHGGGSPTPAGGRYSTVMRPALKASIERHDADPRPMDLIPEVSLLRALVEDYVGRYDMIRDALLAWHTEIQKGSATPVIPARLPDITEAGRLIERVARVADTVHRIATEGSISLDCHRRMMECMGMDVARLVSKREELSEEAKTQLLEAIQEAWGTIRVDTNRRPA